MQLSLLRTLTLAFSLLIVYDTVFSQTQITIIPPSPTSASFAKYGDYPVGMSTGVPDINIPLYTIESGGIKLPISLSYHASGMKVNDISFPVGLGWTLNAGGRVSRTVRDKPDELYPSVVNHIIGQTPLALHEALPGLDIQSDMFFYSTGVAGEGSGRFYFDGGSRPLNSGHLSNPIFFPMTDMKLDCYPSGTGYGSITEMDLTSENGALYKYGVSDFEMVSVTPDPSNSTSAWLLHEIDPISRQDADKISFTYTPGTLTLDLPLYGGATELIDSVAFADNLSIAEWGLNGTEPVGNIFDYTYAVGSPGASLARRSNGITYETNNTPQAYWQWDSPIHNVHAMKNVATISYREGQVTFLYDNTGTYMTGMQVTNNRGETILSVSLFYSSFTGASRQKLDSVVINGAAPAPQTYKFDYTAGDNITNSRAQDFWGFYNGATTNTSMVPTWNNIRTVDYTYYDPNTDDPEYVISDTNTIGDANRWPDEITTKQLMLQKITYPTGGVTTFEFEGNRFVDPATGDLIPVGGLRIKKMITDPVGGSPITTLYRYGIGGTESGIAVNYPTPDKYMTENLLIYPYVGDPRFGGYTGIFPSMYARKRTFSSTPNREIAYFDGSPIWYTSGETLEVNANGDTLGKTVYQYDLPYQDTYDPIYADGMQLGSVWKSYFFGGNSPILSYKIVYKSSGNNYTPVESTHYNTLIFPPQFIGWNYLVSEPEIYCDKTTAMTTLQIYGTYDPFDIEETQMNIFTYKSAGESHTVYGLNSAGILDSTTSTDLYGYNNTHFSEPVNRQQSLSNGNLRIWTYSYPQDYGTVSTANSLGQSINNLQNLHCYSCAIEEITNIYDANSNKESVSNAKFNVYNTTTPWISKVMTTEFPAPVTTFTPAFAQSGIISTDPSYKDRILFPAYTSNGKLLQQQKPGDMPTSYVWGYNSTLPVAEVKGADYSTISGLFSQATLDNAQSTDDQVRTELNKIRTGLAGTKALVNTYTFKPLVGVTSHTDANGLSAYFEYDAAGRLVLVRDNDQNILKRYCYNYAGQPDACQINIDPTWQSTGSLLCQTGTGGYNTGHQEQQQKDINTNSPTYNTLRWADIGVNNTACPITPDWEFTSTPAVCIKNAQNQNTGHIQRQVRDLNPYSPTYNTTQWIDQGVNLTSCPLPVIYAMLTNPNTSYGPYDDAFGAFDYANEDVVISFYSDEACTQPLAVSNLTVYVDAGFSDSEGNSSDDIEPYVCNGASTTILTQVQFINNYSLNDPNDPEAAYFSSYNYFLTPGNGYVIPSF